MGYDSTDAEYVRVSNTVVRDVALTFLGQPAAIRLRGAAQPFKSSRWDREDRAGASGWGRADGTPWSQKPKTGGFRIPTRSDVDAKKKRPPKERRKFEKRKAEGKAERKGDARGGRDASIAPNAAPPG